MKVEEKGIEKHVFVCTNAREVGDCCANVGATEFFKELKQHSREDPIWKGKISVTKCGCLGFCSKGVAAVVYPTKEWVTELSVEHKADFIKKVEEL